MKKREYIFLTICALMALLLITACAQDKGSYDYAPENKITISGLEDSYHLVSHEAPETPISPTLEFGLHDTDDLTYSWQVDYKEVCDHPQLDVPIDASVGKHKGVLIVTDNESTLKYYATFNLYIETPYTYGLAVLSEAEDGTAKLSFQRRDIQGKAYDFLQNVFEADNPDWGKLGEKPIGMVLLNELSDDNTTKPVYQVLSASGDKLLTILDASSMVMTKGLPKSQLPDAPSQLEPSLIAVNSSQSLVLANGKLYTYDKSNCGQFCAPKKWDANLSWVDFGNMDMANYGIPAFDEATHQFVVVEMTDEDAFSYTKVTPWYQLPYYGDNSKTFASVDMEGLTLVKAQKMNDEGFHFSYKSGFFPMSYDLAAPEGSSTERFVFKDSEGHLHLFTFDCEICSIMDFWTGGQTLNAIQSYGVTEDRMITDISVDDHTVIEALPQGNYWLFANGREIRREYYSDGSTSRSFSLPAEVKGVITSMTPSADETQLYVGVYDASSSETSKGSIAVFSINANNGTYGNLLNYYENVCCKPITIIEKTK